MSVNKLLINDVITVGLEEKTRWLYCVELAKYSIRLEGYLCTSCLLPAFDDA